MFWVAIGAKRPTYGQNVLYGGTELYGLAPYFCSYRIIVLYGKRYDTAYTVPYIRCHFGNTA